jgi:hypothetical protein
MLEGGPGREHWRPGEAEIFSFFTEIWHHHLGESDGGQSTKSKTKLGFPANE